MKQKIEARVRSLSKKQRIAGLVILTAALVAALFLLWPAQRSVAAYCKVYKAENVRLTKTRGAAVFENSSNNSHDFAVAYGKLDRVAPSDIEPDIKTLKLIFDKIEKDRSQAFSASLSGIGAESSVKNWTTNRCGS